MRKRQKDLGSLPILRFMGVALVASLSTACSSDIMRFSDQPFGNPFSGRADTATTTGAVSAPIQRVKASTLGAPPSFQPLPGQVGGTGAATSTLVSQVAANGQQAVSGSVAGWSGANGTPVTVGSGDTIEAISGRYGVPVAALRSVNGLSSGQPSAGQRLVIPAYNPGAAASAVKAAAPRYSTPTAPVAQAPARAAAPVAAAKPRTPRYESLNETASAPRREARAVAAKPAARPAADDDDEPVAALKKSEPRKVQAAPARSETPRPVARAQAQAQKPVAAAQPRVTPKATKPAQARADEEEDEAPAKVAAKPQVKTPAKVAAAAAPKVEPRRVEKTPKVAEPAPVAEPVKTAAKPKADSETTGSVEQEFRWPARGRVISGYGSKGPSGANDGINIALPEGTPVKATEGGTVAYAGEEIKGYGKMVLIRHPNGYVSAYAHNGDLNVKRGEAVKRGQVIAKSGQSGNVTSPQLHFELRKGSEPVDPSKHLDGN